MKLILVLLCFGLTLGCTKKQDNKRANYIHRAFNSNIKGLDPATGGSDYYAATVIGHMMEPLYNYAYLERPFKIEPRTADGMPEISKDGKVYKVKIKKGLLFHDDKAFKDGKGRELIADDYIFAWKRLADPAVKSTVSWIFEGKIKGFTAWKEQASKEGKADYSKPIEGFKAVDSHTLEITLEKPYPQLVYVLAMDSTAPIAREVADHYKEEIVNHPVGTGPYAFEEWIRNSEVVMKRNPTYRQEFYPSKGEPGDEEKGLLADAGKQVPLNDGVVIKEIVEDQPRWLNFRKGNLDYADIPKDSYNSVVVNGKVSDELASQGVWIYSVMDADVVFTAFNMDDSVVGKNKYLRQALTLAVDDKDFIDKFYNGRGISAHGPIPPGIQGYDPDFKNPYKGPDIPRAKGLLKKAGYANGKGLPELVYHATNGATARQIAEWQVAQFAKIGVKMRIEISTWPEFSDKLKKRKAQIFGMAWNADYPDAENFLQLFYGPHASPGANNSNYNNPVFNKLFEKAVVMQDTPERRKLYKQMIDIVVEDCPWSFTAHRKVETAAHGWLKNFKGTKQISNYTQYLKIDHEKKKELLQKL